MQPTDPAKPKDGSRLWEIRGSVCTAEENIDSGFARLNTIITSLEPLDEDFSSKNYVKMFLRALHPKWRAKVTAIEELKDLSSLALDELIGNLKWDETSTSGSDDEEYDMAVRNFKRYGFPNHLIGDCPKPSRNKDQKSFIGGSWSDSENEAEDKTNDETCLMAQSSNEENDWEGLDEISVVFDEYEGMMIYVRICGSIYRLISGEKCGAQDKLCDLPGD
ncbi:hypothetical protein Tco_1134194 [Tanacetum coccineum]